MVIVLRNQLAHLGKRVFPRDFAGDMTTDIGDFRPYDQAAFIAQVVKHLAVLVMRQPDAVRAHAANPRHIFAVFFFADGPAHILPVLMPANAVQRMADAIEEKAALGIDVETPVAVPLLHAIQRHAVLF